MPKRAEPVYTVTDARSPLSEDIGHRKRWYLISMGIRTACLILALAVPLPLPLRVVALGAAIVLPYFAVVVANGGRARTKGADFGSYEPAKREPREIETHHRQIGP